MTEPIIGYKAYNKGLTNQFGEKFEIGKEYVSNSKIKWKKQGYHFAERLEDVLRYYNGFDEIDICLVMGYGDIHKDYDSYYDYETIVSSHLKIIRILSREEIITYAQTLSDQRLCRFVSGYKLTEDEIELLTTGRSELVQKYVRYYQYGEEDVFRRK